jgi:membrane fusion protein (multidrug efflux system)
MKRYNLLTLPCMIALASLISCGGKAKTDQTEQQSVAKPKVRVETVSLEPVDQISTFTATVQADKTNNIAPAMGGRIRQILVDVGSNVSKGQSLVIMDAANLTQQQTQVATLRRDYEGIKSYMRWVEYPSNSSIKSRPNSM